MKEAKRVNSIFSAIIVLSIVSELIIGFFFYDAIDLDNLIINEAFVEGILLLPAIVGILIFRDKSESLSDRLMFKKLRPKALLAVFLYALAIIPIGTLANAVSLLFTDNTVTESSDLYLSQDIMTALLFVAIVGPFVEEFVFRAVIYKGYRKAGGRIGAVVLSSLLFGLMHMNLNQLVYAFVVGMLLAIVAEAAGSIWAPLLCHLVFNAENVSAMFISDAIYEGEEELSYTYSNDEILESIILYALISAVAIMILILLLRWITTIQDTSNQVKEIFTLYDKEERKNRLFTPSLIIGILFSVGYIILLELSKVITI